MKITIEVPEFINKQIHFEPETAFSVEVSTDKDNNVVIRAGKEGLTYLARRFLTLAQDSVPDGFGSLKKGSKELIIKKSRISE